MCACAAADAVRSVIASKLTGAGACPTTRYDKDGDNSVSVSEVLSFVTCVPHPHTCVVPCDTLRRVKPNGPHLATPLVVACVPQQVAWGLLGSSPVYRGPADGARSGERERRDPQGQGTNLTTRRRRAAQLALNPPHSMLPPRFAVLPAQFIDALKRQPVLMEAFGKTVVPGMDALQGSFKSLGDKVTGLDLTNLSKVRGVAAAQRYDGGSGLGLILADVVLLLVGGASVVVQVHEQGAGRAAWADPRAVPQANDKRVRPGQGCTAHCQPPV